jgi:5-methyltetrahydropteroyltriglutamate--homocysteine methyltransferase
MMMMMMMMTTTTVMLMAKVMREEVEKIIRLQEGVGLDVLVGGEVERSDMVEWFAEQLDGMAATEHGWVRVYGSRCVRPPIIYADVSRQRPLTVESFRFAQSLTARPVKAVLTGPMTLLNWSFPRRDKSIRDLCLQLALAIRDEVRDLEIAGAKVIQVSW